MKNQIVGNDKILIGRRTDDNVREFAIDVTELVECMDDGYTIAMYAVLPTQSDDLAYPISSDNFRVEGNTLYWIPTDADTSVEGVGKLQICLYNDNQLVNSLIYKTVIGKTLAQGAEPPEVYEPFLLEVERLRDEAVEAKEAIDNMTATATVDSETGTPSVTVTKTTIGDHENLEFAFSGLKGEQGIQGEKGDKGDKGDAPDLSDTIPLMDGTASAGTSDEASRSDHVHPHDTDLLPTDTASGNPVSITDAWAMNAEGLEVKIEPIQDLHGYDSPWPAGGGKNKWDFANPSSTTNASLTDNGDGTYSVAGSEANSKLFYLVTGLTAGQVYSIKIDISDATGNTSIFGYSTVYDGSDVTATALLSSSNLATRKEFTPTGDTVYIAFSVTGGSGSGSATCKYPTIEAGSSISSYSPYSNICPISGHDEVTVTRTDGNGQQGIPLTIPLGDTVYGGTVDVTNGTLTVDRAMVELEDLDWSDSTSTRYISKTVTGMMPVPSPITLPNVIVEQYRVVKWSDGLANNHDGIAVSNNNNARLYLYKDADTQSPTGKLVYELATPITISLTPQQLALLQGDNVISSDGTVTLTYKCEIQKYIAKLIASLV